MAELDYAEALRRVVAVLVDKHGMNGAQAQAVAEDALNVIGMANV